MNNVLLTLQSNLRYLAKHPIRGIKDVIGFTGWDIYNQTGHSRILGEAKCLYLTLKNPRRINDQGTNNGWRDLNEILGAVRYQIQCSDLCKERNIPLNPRSDGYVSPPDSFWNSGRTGSYSFNDFKILDGEVAENQDDPFWFDSPEHWDKVLEENLEHEFSRDTSTFYEKLGL